MKNPRFFFPKQILDLESIKEPIFCPQKSDPWKGKEVLRRGVDLRLRNTNLSIILPWKSLLGLRLCDFSSLCLRRFSFWIEIWFEGAVSGTFSLTPFALTQNYLIWVKIQTVNPTRKYKFKEHLHIANTTQIQPIRLKKKKNPNFHSYNLHITQNILTHPSKKSNFHTKTQISRKPKILNFLPFNPNSP